MLTVGTMRSVANLETIAIKLLEPKALQLLSCRPIQSLWAGYGHICRVEATRERSEDSQPSRGDENLESLILKFIQPPTKAKSGKSKSLDEGHVRKILSYQIEQYFYTHLAPQMPASVGVALCLSSVNSTAGSTHTTAMIMTDLRKTYPVAGEEEAELSQIQIHAALRWLAEFHGFWWSKVDELRNGELVLPPLDHHEQNGNTVLGEEGGVWLNGGYTYLATRRKEYADLLAESGSEWLAALCNPLEPGMLSIAEFVANFLSPAPEPLNKTVSVPGSFVEASQPYQTLIHGDIKSENLFTTAKGDAVAFYDFQYVGLGLGVCDLAKLFTCSVPLDLLLEDSDDLYRASELPMQPGEKDLLQVYLSHIGQLSGKAYDWQVFVRHWETALVDWLRFQASWGFWGNSEWLEARVRSILKDESWKGWLKDSVGG